MSKSSHDFSYVYGRHHGPAVGGVTVSLDDQERVVVTVVLDAREKSVEDSPYYLAMAVDVVASWFDHYRYIDFRHFDLAFAGVRALLSFQKQKDRYRSPLISWADDAGQSGTGGDESIPF